MTQPTQREPGEVVASLALQVALIHLSIQQGVPWRMLHDQLATLDHILHESLGLTGLDGKTIKIERAIGPAVADELARDFRVPDYMPEED